MNVGVKVDQIIEGQYEQDITRSPLGAASC